MPLKIIGAGLGRTGTLSLKFALEQIGLGPCYHMTEAVLGPRAPELWLRAANGNPDWEATFDGFAASVDFPGCTFWRQLAEYYPDAKVLLSVRDPEEWFESAQATIFSEPAIRMLETTPLREFMEKINLRMFGGQVHNHDVLVNAFERHNAEVQSALPASRLLVYNVSQGWEPLCRFMGVPVPEIPFPRANSRDEIRARMAAVAGQARALLDAEHLREAIKTILGRS
jgi:Sulfotransferase domain